MIVRRTDRDTQEVGGGIQSEFLKQCRRGRILGHQRRGNEVSQVLLCLSLQTFTTSGFRVFIGKIEQLRFLTFMLT